MGVGVNAELYGEGASEERVEGVQDYARLRGGAVGVGQLPVELRLGRVDDKVLRHSPQDDSAGRGRSGV